MSKSFITETADELIYIAESDMITVKKLLSETYHPADRMYNIICFHTTQAVEKFLKSYLINNGKDIEKTHDLEFLNKSAKKIDASFEKIENDSTLLNTFIANIKYSTRNQISKQDMNKIIKSLDSICNFPPIKTLRDSFSKKHGYEIITEIIIKAR